MTKGVHFLMRRTTSPSWTAGAPSPIRTLSRSPAAKSEQSVTFDHCIIAAGATTRLLPGTSLSDRVVTYEEQIMTDDRRRRSSSPVRERSAWIRVRDGQLRRRRDDRGVLDRMVPLRTSRSPRTREAVQEARRQGSDGHQGRVDHDSGDRVSHRVTGRRGDPQVLECRQGAAGNRIRPADGGLRAGQNRIRAHRAGRDQDRRLHATACPHLLDRGLHGEVDVAHLAEAQGIVAAETIAGAETIAIDYSMVPRAT